MVQGEFADDVELVDPRPRRPAPEASRSLLVLGCRVAFSTVLLLESTVLGYLIGCPRVPSAADMGGGLSSAQA